jgi:predicted Zn-dependent protease
VWICLSGALAIAFSGAMGFAACGGRPPPRDRPRQVILKSEDVDRKVGGDSALAVKGQLGLIEDPKLVAYVAEVGGRLARHAPQRRFSYKFQIVDQEAPNAFALPGGYIFVSRGLLTLANSEDELANVLGHEIVHVAARHAAARQEIGQNLPLRFNWFQGGYLASYGRDQEREADRLGQGLSAVAGYDPEGLVVFLRELEHTERLQLGASRLPNFWATHPATTSRVAEASARAQMTSWERVDPIASSRADFLRLTEGLAIGTRASEGVFIDDRFLHADLDLTVRFPSGWTTRNTHQAVGAVSPQRDAQVFLEHQGKGSDPQSAAAEYVQELTDTGFEIEDMQSLVIGPYPAFRVFGRFPGIQGHVRVVLTWLARDDTIYRFTGAAPGTSFNAYKGTLLNVPRSFRPLRSDEREKIREMRLRIAVAREGESLSDLSIRTANRWDIQYTAVVNDLFTDHVLDSGQLVKVAIAEDYRPDRDQSGERDELTEAPATTGDSGEAQRR